MSRTLILVKPDAFERALTGEVIARFERKGLRIAALKTMRADEAIANEHYAEHTEKPFFGELVSFITGGPLVAMVLEGAEAVKAARQLIGATNPVEAAPGSIRGDFALEVTFNMVHGSDSDESAEREIGIWFPELVLSVGPRIRIAAAAGDPREAGSRVRGRRSRGRGADAAGTLSSSVWSRTRELKAAARGVRARPAGALVIACDTDVVLDGEALGKPADAGEAREYLDRMSGRAHEVMSGLVVRRGRGGAERAGADHGRLQAS